MNDVTAMSGPVISDDYRRLQQELHRNPDYGAASVLFAPLVADVIKAKGFTELLDYGAGKGRLADALRQHVATPLTIYHYDPAIPEWSRRPEPCSLVACIDVLEHIEADYLLNVLDDLKRVVASYGVFTVATGPARKFLSDGRNAHLIQKPASWWLPLIMERFELVAYNRMPYGFWVVVEVIGK
jgi:hypothetical protein